MLLSINRKSPVLRGQPMGTSFVILSVLFTFLPAYHCSLPGRLTQDFCDATQPMDWSVGDQQKIRKLIEELGALPHLQKLFLALKSNGYTKFQRFHRGAFVDFATGRYTSAGTSAWASPKGRTLNFSDRFFLNNQRDPIGGYPLQKAILLHELAHGATIQAWYEGFLSVAGWIHTERGERVSGLSESAWSQLKADNREWVRLLNQGQVDAAYRLNRESGLVHGFPSAYAFDSSMESFAEWVTAVALAGPQELARLRPEVVAYLRATILDSRFDPSEAL